MEVKKTKITKITIPMICTLLSFFGGCISYFYIKKEIPLQWDINWEVSRWAPKESVFALSAIPVLLYVVITTKAASKAGSKEKAGKITTIAITYLLIMLQWISIATALDITLNIKRIIPIVLGIVFMIVGNFMPTLKRNLYIGFRTPWSVRNDISWKKTNRFGGYLMSIIGFLMVIFGVIQAELLLKATIFFVVLGILYGIFYSYQLRNAE